MMAKIGFLINRVLEAVGLVKISHLRKTSTPSIFSDAYSSGLLPALGSNQSTRNVIAKKHIIHPYDRRYRFSVLISLYTVIQLGEEEDTVSASAIRRASEGAAMGDAGSNSPRNLRILFCGDEFAPAEFHTRQHLQHFPHLHLDSFSREEVPDRIADYDICVPRMMRLDAAVIARASRLQLIVQFGVGLEGVDIEAATRAGIKVARIPGADTGNSLSCAEHCIYMILGLLRHQKDMASSIASKRLGAPAGSTLYGKTVFILGYGHIGKELAPRLRCFGAHVLAVRRSWTGLVPSDSNNPEGLQNAKAPDGDDSVHEKGGIEHTLEFASRADIVVTCCTLNPLTKGIVNATFLAAMKKGAYVVNVARGGLLDYDAVLAALKSGHLGGLAIDVAWTEPFDPSDPILQFSNVLITPHIAGVTSYSYHNMGKIIADSADQLSKGMPMPGIEFAN